MWRVDGRRPELLAAHLQGIGERRCGPLVVHRLKRKHHIVGRERMAVGEGDVRPELEGDAPALVGARPTIGEVRLDRLRRLVDSHQLGLRQDRHEVGGRVGLHIAD